MLLKRLHDNIRMEKNQYGQVIYVKDVPDDGDYAGDFDPRVLRVAEQAATRPKTEACPTLEEIRASMGWKNQDVTKGAITGECRVLNLGKREVCVNVYGWEPEARKPCLLFFHGGGFFGGTVQCVENPCKAMAWYGNIVVVAVDYALAPEHPYPEGLHDCYDVIGYIFEHPDEFGVDPRKIGVAGDSAGGNLAAACAQRDRDLCQNRIRFQALLYPVLNLAALPSDDYTWNLQEYDIRKHVSDLQQAATVLGKDGKKHIKRYLGGDGTLASNPLVSPIFGVLTGLAPALIVNAEYDYLRLEGEAYGRMLQAAGVPAVNLRYRGMDHAFMDKIGEYPQAEDCMREIAACFRRVLAGERLYP